MKANKQKTLSSISEFQATNFHMFYQFSWIILTFSDREKFMSFKESVSLYSQPKVRCREYFEYYFLMGSKSEKKKKKKKKKKTTIWLVVRTLILDRVEGTETDSAVVYKRPFLDIQNTSVATYTRFFTSVRKDGRKCVYKFAFISSQCSVTANQTVYKRLCMRHFVKFCRHFTCLFLWK